MLPEGLALRLDADAWAEQDERDRQDVEARKLRWDEFVEFVQGFAAIEGWPSVLAATSRAMREQHQDMTETDRRR